MNAVDALVEATRRGVRFLPVNDEIAFHAPGTGSLSPEVRAALRRHCDDVHHILAVAHLRAGPLSPPPARQRPLPAPLWLACSACGSAQLLPRAEAGRSCRLTPRCSGVLCLEVVVADWWPKAVAS